MPQKLHPVRSCKELENNFPHQEIPLDQLLEILPKLQQIYGSKAVLVLDAGANNVNIDIKPTKSQK